MRAAELRPAAGPGRLIYVYGFAGAAGAGGGAPPPGGIEPGCAVEWICRGGVAAIVSRVPACDYDEAPLARHLEDAAWVVERARRHGEVLQGLAAAGCVVPCRFGVLFRDDAGVEGALDRHGGALLSALRRLRGKEEWAVKAHVAPAAGSADPEPEPEPELAAAGEGASYLLARAGEHRQRRSAAEAARGRADAILDELATQVDEVLPLPPRDVGATCVRDLFLNLACLVRRRKATAFVACLGRLAVRERDHHVALTWSGPLPPYSFVGELFPAADTTARGDCCPRPGEAPIAATTAAFRVGDPLGARARGPGPSRTRRPPHGGGRRGVHPHPAWRARGRR